MVNSAGIAGLLLALLVALPSAAQTGDTSGIFLRPVDLDTFVVRNGFDVNAFIRRVRADTTFYKAFKSLHLVPYSAVNNICIYNKKGGVAAADSNHLRQQINGHCRTTHKLEEHTTGDFYKRNGEYNYFTARLFAFLFYADEPKCNESDIVAGSLEVHGKGQLEKSEYQLKQLIFNPGGRVTGVPFMGSRASVFDAGEADKYDFRISRERWGDTLCYVFRITPRLGYEHEVLYNNLTTWFRVGDYSILARDYALSYHTLVYDFDVHMHVTMVQWKGKLYPSQIDYDGNWHIFSQKRERAKFSVAITY